MIIFPNCKINIGLQILRKRSDGYHDIETIMYPIALNDALEFVASTEDSLTVTGIDLQQPDIHNNLVYKALIEARHYGTIPPLKMHLHKAIPIGAGLGGGSSDASHALVAFNQYFGLNLEEDSLEHIAMKIGSDCPFFIKNRAAIARGRGEILTPINIDLTKYYIVLIVPEISISTAKAYSKVVPDSTRKSITTLVSNPIDTWRDLIINDFEEPIFKNHPLLKEIKETMYQNGAVYASMSGSGATIYGLFYSKPNITSLPDRCSLFVIEPNEDSK